MFFRDSLDKYPKLIIDDEGNIVSSLKQLANEVIGARNRNGTVWLFGNGASASIASHVALDLTKQSGVKSRTLSDHAMITAFANDFGYENWIAKSLEYYASKNDLVILISVSGESPSVCRAVDFAQSADIRTIGLSGRSPNNYLNTKCDLVMHVPSHSYNIVENVHSIWLTSIVDYLIGSDTYEVS